MNSTPVNSALTLRTYAACTTPAKPMVRTLVCKRDMLAVIGLMASSAVYGVYALTQTTGF